VGLNLIVGVNMGHKSKCRTDRQKALIARLVAIACIFYGSYVMAELHLGELKMLSATGEPLRAQIPVGQADISIEEAVIDVNLASDAMFERAGLTRDIYLAGVELSIARNSLGDLIVEVIADKPIDRPYIDFLLQLDLPEGRIIREYRLLRNPYAVIDQPYKPTFESNSLGKSGLLTRVVQPKTYKHRVVAGDTLWNVAKRLRPSHMTIVETMDRLYATNPDAFLDGDSTKLRKGYIVSFTSAPESVADPVAKQSEVSLSISEPNIELIPIIDSQPSASTPNDEPIELVDIDVQAQPVVEQAEASDHREVPAVVAEQSVTEEQVILQPDVIQETSDLPVVEPLPADTDVTQIPAEVLPLADKSVAPITVEAELTNVTKQQSVFNIEPQQIKHWLSRLQQLPKDLWVITLVFLLAILVNWRRKSRDANKDSESLSSAQQQPSNSDDIVSDELADSVLDGPFASSHGDEVFNQEHDADVEVQQVVEEGAQLPGAQALETQLNQEIQNSQADEYQTDDYADDDTVDLDPLTIRLDMATLCIEMGDIENAQAVLEEVISEADSEGKAKARAILDSIET
jgi:FimV-like protein